MNPAQGARLKAQEGAAQAPGRMCPVAYRYSPRVFDREPQVTAPVLYVVGGLYGNAPALDALDALVAAERSAVQVIFNGDFHWFDVDGALFDEVERRVSPHHALRGNVETEIASEDSGAGCGCAYPLDVSDDDVSRSNAILERLRQTAWRTPRVRERLCALPMHLTARVGDARIGIVHGDAASLAGWGFAQDQLDKPSRAAWIESSFREARVDIFASSHTCLPVLRRFAWDGAEGVVINNGAAGMPNFDGSAHGVVTRIATRPFAGEALYGRTIAGVHVEAVALRYDPAAWLARFLALWPEGSPAHQSYFRRIVAGPRYDLARAAA